MMRKVAPTHLILLTDTKSCSNTSDFAHRHKKSLQRIWSCSPTLKVAPAQLILLTDAKNCSNTSEVAHWH